MGKIQFSEFIITIGLFGFKKLQQILLTSTFNRITISIWENGQTLKNFPDITQ